MKKITFLTILFVLFKILTADAQYIPEHISNKHVYNFIDELANLGVIDINSAIKPYSRKFIADCLVKAYDSEVISDIQRKEILLLLKEYSLEIDESHRALFNFFKEDKDFQLSVLPPKFTYNDGNFKASLSTVYGANFISNEQGNVRHTWGGLTALAYVGDNWTFWASLRDNYQTNEVLSKAQYLTLDEGGNYKINNMGKPGGEYSEMRGGFAYANDWMNVSFSKDHLEWGDNYHGSNIFSGRTPSFAKIHLNLHPAKWFKFSYYHGFLVSEVVDSAKSYQTSSSTIGARNVFRDKYVAANMFTFIPLKGLNFSFGNSIIYSDQSIRAAYLIPFMFFKSIDHTLTHGGIENQNSQMFINVSSRQIKHLHLYSSIFVDEFSVTRINNPDKSNFIGYKFGFNLSSFPIKNLNLISEFTFAKPMTYQHYLETLTFETNKFNLGHYLEDNSKEIYIALQYRPIKGLVTSLSYSKAEKGNNFQYKYPTPIPVDEFPYMKDVVWSNETISFDANYYLWNNTSVFGSLKFSDIKGFDVDGKTPEYYLNLFTPKLYHGKNTTFNFGIHMGF